MKGYHQSTTVTRKEVDDKDKEKDSSGKKTKCSIHTYLERYSLRIQSAY